MMSTTYSAFFSSGLLAPPNLYPKDARTPPSSPGLLPSSPGLIPPSPGPARGSSPMAIPDDSDIEDLDVNMDDEDDGRARTPTPSGASGRSRSGSTASSAHQQPQNQRPRLRKRRSSLTVGTSPMNAIKSPQRNAGNALHLQQRLPNVLAGSIGRSRGGSLSILGLGSAAPTEARNAQNMNVASQGTSLIGRMRSGSVGVGNLFRSRRNARRLASVPAPAPPPTAPLPALPAPALKHSKSYSLFHNTSIFSNPKAIFSQVASTRQPLAHCSGSNGDARAPASKTKGRARTYSCTKGVVVDTPIDEEMKEN